jgi:hypothetical protein
MKNFFRRHLAVIKGLLILRIFYAFLAIATAGCSTLPEFSMQPTSLDHRELSNASLTPTLKDLINHLQCEVALAINELDEKRKEGAIPGLTSGRSFVVGVDLTADVTETAGVSPSISLLHPLATGGSNRSFLLSGGYSSANHNNVNRNFKFVVDSDSINNISQLKSDSQVKQCGKGKGLGGDLNLKQSIEVVWDHNYDLPMLSAPPSDDNSGPVTDGTTFAVSVDFEIKKSANGGPNWTLERIVGPDNAGSGLISWSRNAKDSVILTFSEVVGAEKASQQQLQSLTPEELRERTEKEKQAQRAAAAAADNALTRALLRRVLPNR